MLVMRRGRLVRSEGIVLPDENKIRVIGENDSYIQWQSKVVDNFFEDTFCGITF